MSLFAILKYLVNHPLNRDNRWGAVLRFIKWQLYIRLNAFPVIYSFTDRAKLILRRGMSGATGNLYCGLHEFSDMGFLLHFLRKDDLFCDIGANIGSYTVLSAAHIGAQTFSFEPVPATYEHLLNNIYINRVNNLAKPHNIALGSQKGTVDFTSTLDSMNHVAAPGDTNKITVEISTLDDVLGDRLPALLKIDVEGFETEVIKGAAGTLNRKELKAIIIELNNSGARYGYDDSKIHETFISSGFEPYLYDPLTRKLTKAASFGFHNTIYIRDIDFVTDRLKNAPPFKVLNKSI